MTEPLKTSLASLEESGGIPVEVEVSTERWSEFVLSDGSVLRGKVTIVAAMRMKDAYDEAGHPMYALNATFNTAVVRAPQELMKPKS